jgi:hypothetical protein
MNDSAKFFGCFIVIFCFLLLFIHTIFGICVSYYILSAIKADTWIWVLYWISMPMSFICVIGFEFGKSLMKD